MHSRRVRTCQPAQGNTGYIDLHQLLIFLHVVQSMPIALRGVGSLLFPPIVPPA